MTDPPTENEVPPLSERLDPPPPPHLTGKGHPVGAGQQKDILQKQKDDFLIYLCLLALSVSVLPLKAAFEGFSNGVPQPGQPLVVALLGAAVGGFFFVGSILLWIHWRKLRKENADE